MNIDLKRHAGLFAKSLVVSAALLLAGAALAWTGPTATAPNGNVSAPINISASGQTKAGYIASSDSFVAPNVTSNQFCISASCITSWAGLASQWTTSGSNIYYNTGNVGVGVSPAASNKLDVAGDVNITGSYKVNGTPISTGGSQLKIATGIVDCSTAACSTGATISFSSGTFTPSGSTFASAPSILLSPISFYVIHNCAGNWTDIDISSASITSSNFRLTATHWFDSCNIMYTRKVQWMAIGQ